MTATPLTEHDCAYHGAVKVHQETFYVALIWDDGDYPNAAFGATGHFTDLADAIAWRNEQLPAHIANGHPATPVNDDAQWMATIERGIWENDGAALTWERDQRWDHHDPTVEVLYAHQLNEGPST
jgi:hypothetical protein